MNMGLTNQSTGAGVSTSELVIQRLSPDDKIIALAGNPNVGKSTVFNSLTGLNQHTGNWPGKTVTNAQGYCRHRDKGFVLVDIPGTYSLMASSVEEEVARDFICFGNPDTVVVVTDATCLERNLNLVLQTLEITNRVVVCVNLLDEARRKGISIDLDELSRLLGVPVAGTSARSGKGLEELMDKVSSLTDGKINPAPLVIGYQEDIEAALKILTPAIEVNGATPNRRWLALRLLEGDDTLLKTLKEKTELDPQENTALSTSLERAKSLLEQAGINREVFRDRIVSRLVSKAEAISSRVVSCQNKQYNLRDRKLDRILTSRRYGIPIMIALLGLIFWLTITGANYPSEALYNAFYWGEQRLAELFTLWNAPAWLYGLLVAGMYRTLAWVISVMLPPMAIFFPMFTLLEDLGYLPRIAFNLDNFFKKACAHGKQALTMCMGFGCNAAGVVGCRIIDSPRERLIAIITNNFVPCNGRFPMLIAIITMFFAGMAAGPIQSVLSALILTGVIVLGVIMTLLVSRVLSKTILKGMPSTFTLELPPYRKPQIGRIIIRSLLDRTLFVLGRAAAVAAPAGLLIWTMANVYVGELSLLSHCAAFLDPFARLFGWDGFILMAFILGFPANEIVVPIIIMSYTATGSLVALDNLNQLKDLLIANGWTWLTAVSVMLFSLMHWPCSTTCWTIKKETRSWNWTLTSILVPTLTGLIVCFILTQLSRLFGLV